MPEEQLTEVRTQPRRHYSEQMPSVSASESVHLSLCANLELKTVSVQEEERQTVFEVCVLTSCFQKIRKRHNGKLKRDVLHFFPPPPPHRAANSSWRTIHSSSLISSGTKLSTRLRKTAGGCCATWFATSSPRTSSSSPAVWVKGSGRSTQERRAWKGDRSTPLKSAASEVKRKPLQGAAV